MEYLTRIRAFRDGHMPLQPILDRQREGMKLWGNPPGRFTDFYPATMLDRRFQRHTGPLLTLLRPTVVLLSGKRTHVFSSKVRKLVPAADIITLLHFAHREGGAVNGKSSPR